MVEVHGAGQRVRLGELLEDHDRPAALREQHAEHEADGTGADDRHVRVDVDGLGSRLAQRLVAPRADAVVAAVVVPVLVITRAPWPNSIWKPAGVCM